MIKYAFVVVAVALAGCTAAPIDVREETCLLGRVEWRITQDAQAACEAAGIKKTVVMTYDGCSYVSGGTTIIISRSASSVRDMQRIAGYDLMHACFGEFHQRVSSR